MAQLRRYKTVYTYLSFFFDLQKYYVKRNKPKRTIANGKLETKNGFQSVGNKVESHKDRTRSVAILFQIARRMNEVDIPLMELSQIEDKDMSTSVELSESSAAYRASVRLNNSIQLFGQR